MIVKKLSLPRRTFLRGVGAAVALPLLDAMVPALSAVTRTAASPVRRLGFVYIPNGAVMQQWLSVAWPTVRQSHSAMGTVNTRGLVRLG